MTPVAAPVIDAHQDLLSRLLESGRRDLVPGEGHVDLARLEAGGVDCVFATLFCRDEPGPDSPLLRALKEVDLARGLVALHRSALALVRSPTELESARATGQRALALTVENGNCLAGSLEVLRVLAHLGVVAFQPVWNGRNDLGVGAITAEREGVDGGLTDLGRRVVAECGRLGVMVDVSHASRHSFHDALEAAQGPVLASHSNCRTVRDHPRNLDDAQIRELAQRGGVMGLNFYPPFLSAASEATVADLALHAYHAANLAGPRVLCLGTDYDGIERTPVDLGDVASLPRLFEELARRGFREDERAGIAGANLLGVWQSARPVV
ncbi:MAG: membrane dipeptidase [Planctomycetes bacterium]|nr:membrane dipeptidase [Planctomycetota bacterium]